MEKKQKRDASEGPTVSRAALQKEKLDALQFRPFPVPEQPMHIFCAMNTNGANRIQSHLRHLMNYVLHTKHDLGSNVDLGVEARVMDVAPRGVRAFAVPLEMEDKDQVKGYMEKKWAQLMTWFEAFRWQHTMDFEYKWDRSSIESDLESHEQHLVSYAKGEEKELMRFKPSDLKRSSKRVKERTHAFIVSAGEPGVWDRRRIARYLLRVYWRMPYTFVDYLQDYGRASQRLTSLLLPAIAAHWDNVANAKKATEAREQVSIVLHAIFDRVVGDDFEAARAKALQWIADPQNVFEWHNTKPRLQLRSNFHVPFTDVDNDQEDEETLYYRGISPFDNKQYTPEAAHQRLLERYIAPLKGIISGLFGSENGSVGFDWLRAIDAFEHKRPRELSHSWWFHQHKRMEMSALAQALVIEDMLLRDEKKFWRHRIFYTVEDDDERYRVLVGKGTAEFDWKYESNPHFVAMLIDLHPEVLTWKTIAMLHGQFHLPQAAEKPEDTKEYEELLRKIEKKDMSNVNLTRFDELARRRQQRQVTSQIRPIEQKLTASKQSELDESKDRGITSPTPLPADKKLPPQLLKHIIGFMRGRYGNSA